MARAFYDDSDAEGRNGSPFGQNLDARVYSLLQGLKPDQYAALQAAGLNDATGTDCQDFFPGNPLLVFDNGACGGSPLPQIDPASLDEDPLIDLRNHDRRAGAQVRHAKDSGSVNLSYGAELTRRLDELTLRKTEFRDVSTGEIVVFNDDFDSTDFAFGEAVNESEQFESDYWTVDGHFDLLWAPDRSLRVEAGLFPSQRWSGGEAEELRSRPPCRRRLGRRSRGTWLRLVYRDQQLNASDVTLAPAATLGLAGRGYSLSDDGRTRSFIGRWDAEWNRHFYTGVELRRELLHDITVALPQSFSVVSIGNGTVDSVALTTNAWLTHGIGVFARGELRESEQGGGSGGDIPLVAGQSLTAGVTWVHPSSLQATLSNTFEGDRPAVDDSHDQLDDYRSTDLSLSLQPFNRRLALQLSLLNLFDLENEIGDDVRGAGRTVLVGARVRF